MSILIDSNNKEHFAGKSRHEINAIAGGKSPAAQEANQAAMLAPLHEILEPKKVGHDKTFSLETRAIMR